MVVAPACHCCVASGVFHVSSLDLRHITVKGEPGKADRLFRAAISAFCSLTRPSRREIDQLEDLALPLFDSVSIESRRFAAAALSECQHAPTALVRRLSGETVDIAAPLLIRSNALTDIDLIALIGSRGLPHARAIARRPGLNRTIEHLVKALMSSAAPDPDGAAHLDGSGPAFVSASNDETLLSQTNAEALSNADRVRSRLRSLMRPARQDIMRDGDSKLVLTDADDFARLREAALTGDRTVLPDGARR